MARVCAFNASAKSWGPWSQVSLLLVFGASVAGSWHEAVLHCAPFQLPASETSINKQEGNCLVNGVFGVFGVSAGIVKKRNMQEIDAWEHYDWLQTPPSDVMRW